MPALSKKLEDAFQAQVNREFSAGYHYLSMATQCDEVGYRGAGSWLKRQFAEEQQHAIRLMDFMEKRGNRPLLLAIPQPDHDFGSLHEMFQNVLEHEQDVTQAINDLYELAREERDRSAQTFLEWYLNEQIEEESSAQEVIDRLRIAGKNEAAMLIVDGELGASPPQEGEA